jgi:cholesterol oxidase
MGALLTRRAVPAGRGAWRAKGKTQVDAMAHDYDWLIIGSGFGGSVSALRLVEKGYKVAVLEKGRRFGPDDFPESNWRLKRWLWRPELGWRGLFAMTFMKHVTVLSGVGVGGGSLVYANTLPVPKDDFFASPSWGALADWKQELAEHYTTARRMLGATETPFSTYADDVVREIARDIGREDAFGPTTVGVYFGEAGKEVPDPYFDGEGPTRTGCIQCGACMLGCKHNAKNTLDKNYLYLAEKRGLVIEADTEVTHVSPLAGGGYAVECLQGAKAFGRTQKTYTAANVIFAGGVMGTVDLLLRLKQRANGLPGLSERVGHYVRTNSEVLMGVVSRDTSRDLSKGIAIGSILHTDEKSHLEPVRYPEGSGFFRLLAAPHTSGDTLPERLARAAGVVFRQPLKLMKTWLVRDWAKHTMILLYMRTAEGYLRLKLGKMNKMNTALDEGEPPKAFIPEASDLGERVGEKIDGMPQSMITEMLRGSPTTAHILGGACMGESAEGGVIDHRHRVFGYDGLYVIDGSAVSANPGVNPSLTICALAERAMTFIPVKKDVSEAA